MRRLGVAVVLLGARKPGLGFFSESGDLEPRDRELAAHAEFRKQLYSYDVLSVISPDRFSSPSR